MKHRSMTIMRSGVFLLSVVLFAGLVWLLWQTIPWAFVRWGVLALCAGIYAVVGLWAWYQRRQVSLFADDLCATLDALMSGHEIEGYQPYEDSLTAKVQGKLMQYFDIMNEGRRQSQRDKQTILYRAQEVAGQEGVGLGLYLANGIITRQKGYISVKSKIGAGTTFSVYLLS